MKFNEYPLSTICSRLTSGKAIKSSQIVPSGKFPVYGGNGIRGFTDSSNFSGNCAIIGRQGAMCGNVHYFVGDAYMTEHAIVVCGNEFADTRYLYYLLSTLNLGRLSAQSAQPGLSVKTISKQIVKIPDINYQRKISSFLGAFDDKIEVNNKIINNLENLMTCLFYEKCIKEHSCKTSLSKIANFLNGLAMQKYPPTTEDESLPVLKIRELRQTFCDDNSDLCSSKINPQYIVNDGDLIFSWSGSLLVDIWSGGKCGLNQHLFKVTSKTHPKWFVFLWIKFHIDKFIAIAQAKATTMGHIKRNDLDKAEVIHLDNKEIDVLDKIFKPQFDLLISLKIQNKALAKIRDLLLPKLLSGEIYLSN